MSRLTSDRRAHAAARALAVVALTGLCVTYLAWKIDLRRTVHILGHANLALLAAGVLPWLVAVWPFAWRWQILLRARGVDAPLGWLVRTYFVAYGAGQVLPTSLGGDAARIYAGTRRYRGKSPAIVGSVLIERLIGGAATLLLAAVGLVLAAGTFDLGPYIWIEALLVLFTVLASIVLFSRRLRGPLGRLVPVLRPLRLDRITRTVYESLHGYREDGALLVATTVMTVFVQGFRIVGIWLLGRSVGVHLSPRPYFVMGPLLFLVMLVPFTINGLAVREAMFVSFLGQLGVGADPAFATGFLFFVLSIAMALPGGAIVAIDAGRGWRLRSSPVRSETDVDDRRQRHSGGHSRLQRGETAPRNAGRYSDLR